MGIWHWAVQVAAGDDVYPVPPTRVFTAANAGPLRPSRELPLVRAVSQFGITWSFDRAVPAGKFVTGDWYVVGPVTVIGIEPKPLIGEDVPAAEISDRERLSVRDRTFVRHGSMLNPPAEQKVGFDSGLRNYFDSKLTVQPPIAMRPGDCLVSSISLRVGETAKFPYHDSGGKREHHDDSPTKTAAVLTCVVEPLPEDAFRPGYADKNRQVYFARNLKRELLPRLSPIGVGVVPEVGLWVRVFERPWINPCFFGWEQPMENMPHYGQWVGQASSVAGLLLMLDLPAEQKEALLVRVIQVGIDYWGLVRHGHPGWQGWGGHGSGRKFPIVFAGVLLGDQSMMSPTRSFPKVEFGEDNQTMHGKAWTGATVVFAGHSGIQSANGKVERPRWGPYEHLPPSEWTQDNFNSESYRRANTSSSWVGQALVLRLLNAEHAWAHPAFFDYVDRWMSEEDQTHRREIMKYWPKAPLGENKLYAHQGQAWEPFVTSMWKRYRPLISSMPSIDSNPGQKN